MTGAIASLPALSASGWIDAAVLGLLVLAALLGAVRGLGGEVGRILALAAGLAVLAVLHGPVRAHLLPWEGASFDVLAFVATVVLAALTASLVHRIVSRGLRIIVEEKYTSYDWLHACDRIVTDYSALGLEAALTGKPVYWYLYDLEEYKRAVGLNIDPMEEIPEASAADGAALGELLARPYDYGALNRFRDTYIDIETEGCTEKLGEHIYGIAEKIYQEISEASR